MSNENTRVRLIEEFLANPEFAEFLKQEFGVGQKTYAEDILEKALNQLASAAFEEKVEDIVYQRMSEVDHEFSSDEINELYDKVREEI